MIRNNKISSKTNKKGSDKSSKKSKGSNKSKKAKKTRVKSKQGLNSHQGRLTYPPSYQQNPYNIRGEEEVHQMDRLQSYPQYGKEDYLEYPNQDGSQFYVLNPESNLLYKDRRRYFHSSSLQDVQFGPYQSSSQDRGYRNFHINHPKIQAHRMNLPTGTDLHNPNQNNQNYQFVTNRRNRNYPIKPQTLRIPTSSRRPGELNKILDSRKRSSIFIRDDPKL